MDLGLYREDEQFTFTSSIYMEYCSSDSTSFTVDHNEDPDDIFEEIRPMRQPPTELFEWETDTNERQLQGETGLGELEHGALSPINTEPHNYIEEQNWGPVWKQKQNIKQEPKETYISQQQMQLATHLPEPQFPETFNDFKFPSVCTDHHNIKSEHGTKQMFRRDSYRTESESSDILNGSFSSTELTNFDIAEYVFEEDKQTKKSIKVEPKNERVVKAGMKKIDLKAQKYIIEKEDLKKSFSEDSECDVDIETISEEESSPILEAGDLTDLLEQFEATEATNVEQNKCQNVNLNVKVEVKDEPMVVKEIVETPKVESKQNMEIKQPMKIKQPEKVKVKVEKKIEQKEIKPKPEQKPPTEQLYINNQKVVQKPPPAPAVPAPPAPSSNRQILASLPQELIKRIKESSGKRKPITVIQPIPNLKKRCKIDKQEPSPVAVVKAETKVVVPVVSCATVHLDHNYCSSAKPIVLSKKDSGFVSSEEDDRAIISRQPTVKNADGTLMVSLLKANTIRQIEPTNIQKKKLNLEEYKKRRNGIITPKTLSQNCSPSSSSCPSPNPEDEHKKMLKHQEKLRKMAEEVLTAAPKGLENLTIKCEKTSPIKVEEKNPKMEPTEMPEEIEAEAELPKVPDNLERKVFVSFGVNTDFKVKKNEDPLAAVVKLQEMKPLLERESDKINESSLISSVIDTIPKVLEKNEKENKEKPPTDDIHGEYKQVVYLEKDRPKCETREVETQTDISLIEQRRRGRIRRRVSSSSSSDSSDAGSVSPVSRRSRKNSDSSMSSRSSTSSYRSSSSGSDYSSRGSSRLSYSRSRSRSPGCRTRRRRRRRSSTAEREHMNAVEERRIIYVGKIKTGTTKDDLRKKFDKFGTITKVSLHFREIGYSDLDSYGFVTFKHKEAAHNAYERGNDDASFPEYKISFGGRREFCKAAYSDLDNVRDDGYYHSQSAEDSYDQLLQEALEKLKKRKV